MSCKPKPVTESDDAVFEALKLCAKEEDATDRDDLVVPAPAPHTVTICACLGTSGILTGVSTLVQAKLDLFAAKLKAGGIDAEQLQLVRDVEKVMAMVRKKNDSDHGAGLKSEDFKDASSTASRIAKKVEARLHGEEASRAAEAMKKAADELERARKQAQEVRRCIIDMFPWSFVCCCN